MASASLHDDSKESAQHADIKKSLCIASLSLYIPPRYHAVVVRRKELEGEQIMMIMGDIALAF
jgi:hypothetical protein